LFHQLSIVFIGEIIFPVYARTKKFICWAKYKEKIAFSNRKYFQCRRVKDSGILKKQDSENFNIS